MNSLVISSKQKLFKWKQELFTEKLMHLMYIQCMQADTHSCTCTHCMMYVYKHGLGFCNSNYIKIVNVILKKLTEKSTKIILQFLGHTI